MNVFDAHKIYFLGIGGIGMSALARYFHLQGKQVEGYDRVSSMVSKGLEDLGIRVFHEVDPERIAKQEVVIYTPAIKVDNQERARAEKIGLPLYKRSQVLGQISRKYKTLAVAGTHGKTTSSTMLTHVLREGGLDVTAFLGGISLNLKSNFIMGKSDWLVVEADEYDRSFLSLHPEWSIITSLDPDHLDIYGTEEEMKGSYRSFARQSSSVLVHEEIKAYDWQKEVESYGPESDFRYENLRFQGLKTLFDFHCSKGSLLDIALPMPGRHNVMNMSAALSIGVKLDLELAALKRGVESFRGIYRRFEVQHHSESLTFIDDYAHHPSELRAVIDTARKLFPERKLMVIFQPHLYSRTRDFLEGFAEELSQADLTFLLPIYPAREEPIEGIESKAILDKMERGKGREIEKQDLLPALAASIQSPSVLLSLGAGDIDREVPRIKDWIKKKFTGDLSSIL